MSDTVLDPPKNRGGRPKGAVNKVTREIRAIAADYGPAAVRRLAVLGGLIPKRQLKAGEEPAKSEATQVVALSHILNRAYGFPSQPLSHSADESFETLLDRLERRRLGKPEPSQTIELQITQDGSFEAVDAQDPEPAEPSPEPASDPAEPQPITDWMTNEP